MIDLKACIAKTEVSLENKALGLILRAENYLKNQIERLPQSNRWNYIYKNRNMAEKDMEELYLHLCQNFIDTGKTQMSITLHGECNIPQWYSAPAIEFFIER